MKVTRKHVEAYIEAKRNAWAESTLKSERHRLDSVVEHLDGSAARLWEHVASHLSPYSRLTTWTRVVDFWDYLKPNEANPYKKWRKENARVFRNVYEKRKPDISFEEARNRIETLSPQARAKALQLLMGGLRFTESSTLNNGRVVGKGGKVRVVYTVSERPVGIGYQSLRRALAKVGLKPHDLRKIFLSRLVEKGANQYELCEVAGWSSIATASSYIAVDAKRISSLVAEATKV